MLIKEKADELDAALRVGNGKFAIDIPFIDKELVFTKEDIEDLKAYLLR